MVLVDAGVAVRDDWDGRVDRDGLGADQIQIGTHRTQPSPTTMVRPEEAKRELARRELARRHLVDFSMYVAPWYRPGRHHRLVAEYLEQVELYVRSGGREGIGRLMVLSPPRHGKSEQASIQFPAWFLGRNPECRVIITSYGLDLAAEFSKKCRDIVMGDKYPAVFGGLATGKENVEISSDSRSVKAWDLAGPHRGGVLAAGRGGGITGKGAHLFILDDLVKNREEAESADIRESTWDWWLSTARTRLEENAAIVASMTHWHADDWAGRVIKKMASDPLAEQYVILWLPARWESPLTMEEGDGLSADQIKIGTQRTQPSPTFEEMQRQQMLDGNYITAEDRLGRQEGRALWPEKYSEADLAQIERDVETYNWASLYQQRTYLRSGNRFKREYFTIVEGVPKEAEIAARGRFWDKAGSKSGMGDYTAGVLMSITKDDVVYVEHLYFERGTPLQREEAMQRLSQQDGDRKGVRCQIWHQQDPGTSGLDSAQMTNMRLAKAGFAAHFELVTGGKETRADDWSSACEAGRVRLVRGAWNEGFIERHVGFPKHRFDDDVDAASWGFMKLASAVRMSAEKMVDFV